MTESKDKATPGVTPKPPEKVKGSDHSVKVSV